MGKGKTLDELNLSDAPLTPTPATSTTPATCSDPRGTAWYRFVQDIDDLLATGKYTWAESTLRDIQETVEQQQRVTEGQRKAVANIEAARGRQDGFRRRGEGFNRRYR